MTDPNLSGLPTDDRALMKLDNIVLILDGIRDLLRAQQAVAAMPAPYDIRDLLLTPLPAVSAPATRDGEQGRALATVLRDAIERSDMFVSVATLEDDRERALASIAAAVARVVHRQVAEYLRNQVTTSHPIARTALRWAASRIEAGAADGE